MLSIHKLRNFGILAHIDSGKTTISERILFYSGATHVDGEVHHGNTTMDFNDLEKQKGITISSAVTTTHWQDHQLNLIDTPGHVDFTAEVERTCRVLDGAVVVFCGVAGVQAQSETVWRQSSRYAIPRIIFINKMDRDGADFWRAVASTRSVLQAEPVVLTYPIGSGDELLGVVDVWSQRFIRFCGDKGQQCRHEAIPAAEQQRAQDLRLQLIERVAEQNETLLEAYCATGTLDEEQLYAGLRAGTVAGRLHPTLGGSALGHVGIQPLLDAIVACLPAPDAVAGQEALLDQNGAEIARVDPGAAKPLVALVYKLVHDAHGEMAYVRVYQGTLRAGDQVLINGRSGERDRITRLVRVHADQRTTVDHIGPGDLCAVIGLRRAVTGDTLSAQSMSLRGIRFAEPVIGMAAEVRESADRERLAQALRALSREDPSFAQRIDPETGQLVLYGMGELHLEAIAHRLQHDYRVPVEFGRPQVGLRARITAAATQRKVYKKQTGGPGSFADCTLHIEPLAEGLSDVLFDSAIRGGAIDRAYIPAVEAGVREALAAGGPDGEPIDGVQVTLLDGSMHSNDSSEQAFAVAGRLAVQEALPQLGVQCLEPWMHLDIACGDQQTGIVLGSLNAKRAEVSDVQVQGSSCTITAAAPLAQLFGYIAELRSQTGGRGSFTMEHAGYRPL